MKKLLLIGSLVSSVLFAGLVKIPIPLPASSLSVENSGTKTAIDAYRDGVGLFITNNISANSSSQYDNQAMNSTVFKYGDIAKNTGLNLKEVVLNTGTQEEQVISKNIGLFEPMVKLSLDVSSCDDGNQLTVNDKYVDGICIGVDSTLISNVSGVISCQNATIGLEYPLNGKEYLIVDNNLIKNNINRVDSICTSKVTDMSKLFAYNKTFNEPLNHWDVSNVINMRGMFNEPYVSTTVIFNQPLNNWDVSKVTDFSSMFSGAVNFNQDISNWKTNSAQNMWGMFKGASSFNKPLNIWNIGNVTNLGSVFEGAYSFNQPLNNWNISKVTNLQLMFSGANYFNQNISNWNTISVLNTASMFKNAVSFNQPIGNWNMANNRVTAFMFLGASSFNQTISNWDVRNVLYTQQMFYNATKFNQYIKSWNFIKVLNYSDFRVGSALTTANSPF